MKNDQFIDAVQTIGIITIAIVLSYVVVRLEGSLNRSADRLKKFAYPPRRNHSGHRSHRAADRNNRSSAGRQQSCH